MMKKISLKFLRKIFVSSSVFSVFFFPQILCADIYSWTDVNGVKHFTNRQTKTENVSTTSAIVQSDEVEYDLQSDVIQQRKYKSWQLRKSMESGGYQTNQKLHDDDDRFTAKNEKGSGAFRVISKGIYEVGGYEINVTGHQRGKNLQIRGRVNYGAYCESLRVDMKLENRDGDRVSVTAHVEDVGGARSGLIREDKRISRLKDRVTDTWHVVNMKVRCEAD